MFKYKIISDASGECLCNTDDKEWMEIKLAYYAEKGYNVTVYVRME
jgi:hypothetical protein